jgi:2-succinyl-6-hydroxy-2,4-cyclohexadiene-1-carboxylate synthase
VPAEPLHAEEWGAGTPVLGLLHGFTQSGAAWASVAGHLPGHLVAPDLPGHGRSAAIAADLWAAAGMVAARVGPAVYVGYSMGGRLALHLALAHPEVVQGLVLISATAGIDDPAERAARRTSDEALATRVEEEGVEAFVRWWLTLPLFATLPPEAAAIDSRTGGSAAGLASSLRLAGAGAQQPLWDRLGEITAPALIIAGGLDGPYCDRGRRLAGALGGPTEIEIIDGAGHACHLERPGAVAGALTGWLRHPAQTANPIAKKAPKTSTS